MTERTAVLAGTVRPLDHQPPLPLDRFLVEDEPDAEAVPLDVVFVGGGPAGLAGAIELAKLSKAEVDAGRADAPLEIGVLDKAGQLGEHSLSGAVVNPRAFHELFPELSLADFPFRRPVTKEAVYFLTSDRAARVPTPPTMRNHGNHVASICEIVRWLGEKAEALGVNVFPGFPVDSLLVKEGAVRGVRTTPAGLGRDGEAAGPDAMPPMDLTARVTVLAEGTRGALSQAWLAWKGVRSPNPQIFALGVKELWRVRRPLDRVIHTMGWPLPSDAFGGSFMYPMADDLVALGLVVGMDWADARFDAHHALQRMKLHPLFRPYLEGGEMVEWGAKTIPEGGYYSVPERRHGDGLVIVGDAAGYVEVSSLKGIHYAMHSGILAARQIFQALQNGDASEAALAGYTRAMDDSFVMLDLKRRRNMRLAFKDGFLTGAAKAGIMTVTGGRLLGGRIAVEEDAARTKVLGAAARVGSGGAARSGATDDGGPSSPGEPRPSSTPRPSGEPRPSGGPVVPDGRLTFSKVDAVFRSGNQTRDDIPSHLIVGEDVSAEAAELYVHMCPAGVYERDGDRLVVNPPNCIDCKATDVLGPRWTPREGGSGPAYRLM